MPWTYANIPLQFWNVWKQQTVNRIRMGNYIVTDTAFIRHTTFANQQQDHVLETQHGTDCTAATWTLSCHDDVMAWMHTHITNPLRGEFLGFRWIPSVKGQ